MAFSGFPADAYSFYEELEAHNNREWWLANKKRFDEQVHGPMAALAEELGGEFGPIKIFRPYRNLRFSADKRPYKEQIAFVTQASPAHYVQLAQEGVMLGGGYYQPAPDQLARFRAIVDDVRLVGDLEATLEEVAEAGFAVIDEDALATAPRGFDRDHPRIGLLRLRNLAITRRFGREPWLAGPEAADRIREAWRVVSVWNDWLADNIGASTSPPRGR